MQKRTYRSPTSPDGFLDVSRSLRHKLLNLCTFVSRWLTVRVFHFPCKHSPRPMHLLLCELFPLVILFHFFVHDAPELVQELNAAELTD